MRAEVISIGDELTSGQRLDTNSQWLSQRLGELGVRVLYHTTVADELEPNIQVFRQALERADLVISTGGLGPTADDLTREALAACLGVDLLLDEEALAHIRQLFAHRRREMPPRNVEQARFPRGSRVVPNPHGTAPGIELVVPRPNGTPARCFALPGVPAEMREMWHQTVAPAVAAMQGAGRVLRHRAIRCYGVGESDLERMLPDLIRRGRTPLVGITASQATLTLRITAEGATAEACEAALEPTVATIRECLGELIFGEGEDELQHAVVRLLAARRQTLATAECASGGVLATWLSEADAARATYRGGWIAHDPAARLPRGSGGRGGDSVSDDAAAVREMALACRAQYQADFALAVGPFPPPAAAGSTPGSVAYALASPQGVEVQATLFAGHPEILTARTVKTALNHLRLTLERNG